MKFGCIGVGNMGVAILRGALAAGALQSENTYIFDTDAAKSAALADELSVHRADSLPALIEAADILLLAVKPHIVDLVLSENSDLFAGKAILSIAAGRSTERLCSLLPESCRVLRIMPNTPALVGEGMILFEDGDTLTAEEKDFARAMFSAIGKVDHVPAHLMDAVTGVSGSGPAYVYMFIEALADGGVRAGLPRDTAKRLAAQTVLGSAKMVLDTNENPEELKDRVCSPGGTTIEAVAALEEHGLRNAVLQAVKACVEKSVQMGK